MNYLIIYKNRKERKENERNNQCYKNNEKRMKKLHSLKTYDAKVQAEKYVIGECLARKIKLTEDEICKTVVRLVG